MTDVISDKCSSRQQNPSSRRNCSARPVPSRTLLPALTVLIFRVSRARRLYVPRVTRTYFMQRVPHKEIIQSVSADIERYLLAPPPPPPPPPSPPRLTCPLCS
ncbi:hypothetical protein EVAR_3347_1 [Eumeta japonica]|uniref:Uncharacterized protein n=1 Tax=Eumeta variegata TaxID=151549 RepID=A0A4C1SSV1_EUMVA|nr:hypothetical protein EVAR_3347_1 [Eumeta japonica]